MAVTVFLKCITSLCILLLSRYNYIDMIKLIRMFIASAALFVAGLAFMAMYSGAGAFSAGTSFAIYYYGMYYLGATVAIYAILGTWIVHPAFKKWGKSNKWLAWIFLIIAVLLIYPLFHLISHFLPIVFNIVSAKLNHALVP